MKAKKIEKAENGDIIVTAEFENSQVVDIYIEVNKYYVPMPSGVGVASTNHMFNSWSRA